jgi:N-acetylmuramoyl-L-alanine amidase
MTPTRLKGALLALVIALIFLPSPVSAKSSKPPARMVAKPVKPKSVKEKVGFKERENARESPAPTPLKKNFPPLIETLQYPAKKPVQPLYRQIIFIDPGHGAGDEGAKLQGCIEKNLCLLTGLHLRNLLEAKGYQIVMTRSHDEYVALNRRVEMANQSNCALFVSIHYNSAKSKEACGVEIFYPKHADQRQSLSKQLAVKVLDKMVGKTGAKSRGIKVGNYHVIRETTMPAILIEGGFITHPIEGVHLTSLHYIHLLSEGIAEGIESYLKQLPI